MKQLEIGPGGQAMAGFDSLDMVDRSGVTFVARWGSEPLPIPDRTYDFVFASHVLEHVPWNQTLPALRELHRILKPSGRVEIWVPDFEYVVQCYLNKRCGAN